MKKVCKHCRLPADQHHEYEPVMPPGCQCDPGEWGDTVLDVCDRHQGNGEYCERCEHDQACHQ